MPESSQQIYFKSINSIPIEELQSDGKLTLVFLTANWSVICRLFFEEIEQNQSLINFLNSKLNVILIEIDERPDLFIRLNAGALPSIILFTSQFKPIWASSYIQSKELEDLLTKFINMFLDKKNTDVEKLIDSREEKITTINENFTIGSRQLDLDIFQRTVKNILVDFDFLRGGFGKAPKLALPSSLKIVAEAYKETGGNDFEAILATAFESYLKKGLLDKQTKTFYRGCIDENMMQPIPEKLSFDSIETVNVLLGIDTILMGSQNKQLFTQLTNNFINTFMDKNTGMFKLTDNTNLYYKEANCMIGCTLIDIALKLSDRQDFTRIAEEIFSKAKDLKHNLISKDQREFLRDQAYLLRLCNKLYDTTKKQEYLESAQQLQKSIYSKFYKKELCGLADVEILNTKEGILNYIKDIEDSAVYADECVELYRFTNNNAYLETARQLLSNFPDQGAGYGHWTANFALAVRKILSISNA
ncbi:MAG: hypothetical protein HY606_10860 [Planctomycetes bacterium]|nr:hypothetical protein [Planctomycetota bacterium]